MNVKSYKRIYRLCIVGAGPSGCYLARSLLMRSRKENIDIRIDLLDALDEPYGLLKYGIAPDKYDLKRLMKSMDYTLFKKFSGQLKFYGNVTLGYDIHIDELKKKYDILVLAVGGSQNFNTLKLKGMNEKLSNNVIGGVFPSRDWVLYYNGHPMFKDMLSKRKLNEIDSIINSNTGMRINFDLEHNYLKNRHNQFFEYKSPINLGIELPYRNDGYFNYGYTSEVLKNHILNSSERNAVVIGNGNVSLDIVRLLSFYSYDQLSNNKYLNPDYLNLMNTSENHKNKRLDQPLFKNIYIVGRRGWIQNSFKYPLLKEFIERHRKSVNDSSGVNFKVMMSKDDFELSQDPDSIYEIEKSGNEIKKRYKKMKNIFQEMVKNHQEYLNENAKLFHNTINVYFKNLYSPLNIKTEEVNIDYMNGDYKAIPFIRGIELKRNSGSKHFEEKLSERESENTIPCQLLITSLGFKPKFDYLFGSNIESTENDTSFCPVFMTGWMKTNSKGDLSVAYNNSAILSSHIIHYLRKVNPKGCA
ncbi:NADP oxidoreductase [Cryptosporidium felis]|nr:NADP oxidoreductase [Cryptosporidium felis]